MNKKVLLPLMMVVIAALSYMAHDAYAASVTLTGKTVDVTQIVKGQKADLTPETAKTLQAKGKPIAFLADNGKVYFVYTASGSNAIKRLVKYAGKKITITGKTKSVGGINVIIGATVKAN